MPVETIEFEELMRRVRANQHVETEAKPEPKKIVEVELSGEAEAQFLIAKDHVRTMAIITADVARMVDRGSSKDIARLVNLSKALTAAQNSFVGMFGMDALRKAQSGPADKHLDLSGVDDNELDKALGVKPEDFE